MWTELIDIAKKKMNNSAQAAQQQQKLEKQSLAHNNFVTKPTTQGIQS